MQTEVVMVVLRVYDPLNNIAPDNRGCHVNIFLFSP